MAEKRAQAHGVRNAEHGPDEKGLGAQRSPDDPRDFLAAAFFAAAGASERPAAALPDSWRVSDRPPVTNQGNSPKCVAYSSATDQNHIDRADFGRYFNFDEDDFFVRIGGTSNGAYMREALEERLDRGYPESSDTKDADKHRIKAYYRVSLDVSSIKNALVVAPHNGGIVAIGPWFHSWFHPFVSGKLPAPDYEVGGHAWWIYGWSTYYQGFRCQNSWGTDWGNSGRFILPYAYLGRLWEVWRTLDR